MSKLIVTHVSPDFDGIPAIWLLKRFHPDFKNARVAFVPVGDATYNNEPVDSNPDVLHVDCGGGKFDHHHTNDLTCGAQLVYEWLVKEGYVKDDEALERMAGIFTEIDHAWDNYKWLDAGSDQQEFLLHNVLVGWKMTNPGEFEKYVEWISHALDAVYAKLTQKIVAEKAIKEGKEFKTRWGKAVGIYSANDSVLDATVWGDFAIAFRKDPQKGFVRITGSNKHKVDLTKAYELLKEMDPESTWFLHASKVLLRNGSTRNPTMVPTKLGVDEIIKVLEKA